MPNLTLYHGSVREIRKPIYGYGRNDNDFGRGFYCTESEKLSREWACQKNTVGISNKYTLNTNSLEILDLQSREYSVMNWIAVLMKYRRIEPNRYNGKEIMEDIDRRFFIDLDGYDVVKGYRADDSYYLIAGMFIDGLITYGQLRTALKLGDFGEQIVLKSQKAFDSLEFVSSEELQPYEHYRAFRNRESGANERFETITRDRKNPDDLDINSILEVDENDPRLF